MDALIDVRLMPPLDAPYQRLLVEALTASGCKVTVGVKLPRRGVYFGKRLDIIHLHWLNLIFPLDSCFRSALALCRFLFPLAILKVRGTHIVWTAHEITSHDSTNPEFERRFALWILPWVDQIIVHNEGMRAKVKRLCPAVGDAMIHLIPHGHFIDYYHRAYQGSIVHEMVKKTPGAFRFLAMGYMRRNKGTDLIIRAFRTLAGSNLELWLIGDCEDASYRQEIQTFISADPRIRLEVRRHTDSEFVQLHETADVSVFAFTRCDTSGSLISAMSVGAAIIAPRIGHVRDLLDDESAILYEAKDKDGLVRAMKSAVDRRSELPRLARRSKERIRLDKWEEIGRRTRNVYLADN